jgi:uncharacterized protein YqeY
MDSTSLKKRIEEDMKTTMRAQNKQRLAVIRLIMAAVKQREVDERITLNDEQVLAVLDKMVKQRRDSVSQYQTAGRQDLVDQESYEITVIQEFMPAALSETEIDAFVSEAITASGAKSAQDMGKIMAILKPKVQGRADMGKISAKVKARLAG